MTTPFAFDSTSTLPGASSNVPIQDCVPFFESLAVRCSRASIVVPSASVSLSPGDESAAGFNTPDTPDCAFACWGSDPSWRSPASGQHVDGSLRGSGRTER